MFFPIGDPQAERNTASLVLLSNIPVLLLHFVIYEKGKTDEMVIINFLAAEPKNLGKILYVDLLVLILQIMLIQFMWSDCFVKVVEPEPRPVQVEGEGGGDVEEGRAQEGGGDGNGDGEGTAEGSA